MPIPPGIIETAAKDFPSDIIVSRNLVQGVPFLIHGTAPVFAAYYDYKVLNLNSVIKKPLRDFLMVSIVFGFFDTALPSNEQSISSYSYRGSNQIVPASSSRLISYMLGTPFLVKYGEKVPIANENSKLLEIQFSSLLEDSRCRYAEGAVCKWEGNARVVIRVFASDINKKDFELNTSSRYQRGVDYLDYKIRLLAVHPRNDEIRGNPPHNAYSIELMVEKLS